MRVEKSENLPEISLSLLNPMIDSINPCSENNGIFVFANAKVRFSHDGAQTKSFCLTNNIYESSLTTNDYFPLC